ncbi:GNAT family N-acetyltransferase [Actinomadura craniellae]|uniref:GNAT family N-acetyltransferase n=1 Tax=Actinomadura craniellae TaxID=2231787 RepID=A0A365H0E5_9ACTN|nr:GNAT family N-acetyltransferase [Actinomadura craniellae]RAY12565.1 GNAT family N-acetyltransferase [Actinomadura craniellae]
MLGSLPVRVLDDRYRDEVLSILDSDPVENVFVASRVHAAGLEPGHLGAQMWGYLRDGRLTSLCYSGANLIPIAATGEALRAFAERARAQGRRCSSIVGPLPAVAELWDLLEPYWGPARAIRTAQPVLATSQVARVAADPAVRRVRMAEFDIVYPACVAMFTEEVGVSPHSGDGGMLYRSRVAELIRAGRSFARIENGRVLFKAEVGAVTPYACQVQGVWVHPDLRGRGLSVPGMAALVAEALRTIAPTVTLYVNDYNVRARAAYEHVGFAEVGTFMSVLF